MSSKIEKWNARYLTRNNSVPDPAPEPAIVLKEYEHLLPEKGDALDLACGLGGNALFLAKKGLRVHAWDFSPVAIDCVLLQAKSENLSLITEIRDISLEPPQPSSFDVIVVSYFLDRSLIRKIKNALKPGGLLFYQTFTREKVADLGPSNPEYLLEENELLDLFRGLQVRVYREEALCGNTKKGLRNEALFVGQKTR